MKKMKTSFLVLCFCCLSTFASGNDQVTGTVTTFHSYNEIAERCVQISPIPGGEYDEDDIEDEESLCGFDFYSDEIAICPKIWSTSAAVAVYDISEGRFAGQRTEFQEKVCQGGKVAKYVAKDKLAYLKFTMNQELASNVFTPSSLMYYHFARFFDFSTYTPVAVWRSIDKNVLLNEVALTGVNLSENREILNQNNAGWRTLVATIDDPDSYDQPDSYGDWEDLMTDDQSQMYGVMYDGSGDDYGPEINGPSKEQWSMAVRYRYFLQSPAFIALASDSPLVQSIDKGLDEGSYALSAAGLQRSDISAQQMAFWMREISEILLLDFMMGQQDRLGNIEYKTYYYWLEDGKIKKKRARELKPGEGKIPLDAIPIQRSRVNDNDAGGRDEYDNHTKDAGLLEMLRHFDASVYQRLIELESDFKSEGPIFQWLTSSLGVEPDHVGMIVANTLLATEILRSTCLRGELSFDLNPKRFFETGEELAEQQSCTGS